MFTIRTIAAALSSVICAAHCLAADSDSQEVAAAKLSSATITVRVSLLKTDDKTKADDKATDPAEVTVCSGIALGKDLIVTFSQRPNTARFRVTLPGGEQAEAQPRVIDYYTGLRLLEVKDGKLAGLEIAESLPPVAAPVLTAAAAGLEKPAVSLGILSGTDRSLPGTELPPLLQCDLRTTETSAGAGIIDKHGRLIGIVAATAAPGERAGWTYAIPAQHVVRLQKLIQPGQIIEVKRLRPVAGLTIGPGEKDGTVIVERVVPGGPADKAGLKAGDQILEAEGKKIRSAYQALDPIMKRQPGEKVTFAVQQGDHRRDVELTLGGANVMPAVGNPAANVLVGPQLVVTATEKGLQVRNSAGVQELSADTVRPRRSLGDEVEMLRTQLSGFEQVILKLQGELQRRTEQQQETDKLIRSLRNENESLHKQLDQPARR